MDTVRDRTTPPVKDHERHLVQPWFALTGLDESSAEWTAVWKALTAAELAGEHGLTLWPTDREAAVLDVTQTVAARTVRMALESGALYALPHGDAAPSSSPGSQVLPLTPSLGVEIVLGLLHRDEALFHEVLQAAPQDAVQRILAAARGRVVGVYGDAPTALAAQIARARSESGRQAPDRPVMWPLLVEVILRAAVTDEVFAEHVLLELRGTPGEPTDFLVLPGGGWMVFVSPEEPLDGLRSSGNLLD